MYSIEKYGNEHDLRQKRINIDYPILFNRINWDLIEENMGALCKFQQEHNDILPRVFFTRKKWAEKIIPILEEDHEKIMDVIVRKHSNKFMSYDSVYEFLQKYPEWNKLVFYDENSNDIYDEFLTTHIDKSLPIEFNRINWEKVDEKIDRIYEIFMNQKEKITVPFILFLDPGLKGLSEHYITVSLEIFEYYDEEYFTKNNPLVIEYDDNQKYDNYDGFYHFIKDYPELSDIVYFDPSKE